jgi:hypothetical protein
MQERHSTQDLLIESYYTIPCSQAPNFSVSSPASPATTSPEYVVRQFRSADSTARCSYMDKLRKRAWQWRTPSSSLGKLSKNASMPLTSRSNEWRHMSPD